MNRAQQSGYGLGQGPPPSSGGRFSSTPSRQGSTPLSPQQQQLRQPFAFGQGQMGLGAMSPQQGASLGPLLFPPRAVAVVLPHLVLLLPSLSPSLVPPTR